MAAPIRPISPLPFGSFSQTLTVGTVSELTVQPFSNTKEIIILNLSENNSALVRVADASATQAFATITVPDAGGPTSPGLPVVGATITLGASTLTAVSGAPAVDQFSVPTAATAAIQVVNNPLGAGDTVVLQRTGFANVTLTGVLGPRAPGSFTFQVDGGSAIATATSITAAINDIDFGGCFAANGGTDTVTVTAPATQGATPNAANQNWTLVSTTTPAGGIAPASVVFAGGVDAVPSSAELTTRATDPTPTCNSVTGIARNIVNAINDAGNTFSGILRAYTNAAITAVSAQITLVAVAIGAAGNGVVVASASPQLTVSGNTAGGVNALGAVTVTALNSLVIPPSGAITLSVGSEGNRQPLASTTWWNANPGSKLDLVATSLGADATSSINVTYVQDRGYPGGV